MQEDGFHFCSPMAVLLQVNGLGDCGSWQQQQQKGKKKRYQIRQRKGWELRLGKRIYFYGYYRDVFFPSPHPHLYPSHLLLFFPPSSNVSVPCCYTISHLLMVFKWSQSFSLLHLIKRSSELIECVKFVCGRTHMRIHILHYNAKKKKRNEPRTRHNELLIMCFGGSCYSFFHSVWTCLSDSSLVKTRQQNPLNSLPQIYKKLSVV